MVVAIIGGLGYAAVWNFAASNSAPVDDASAATPVSSPPAPDPHATADQNHRPSRPDARRAVGKTDGIVPDGVTVFNADFPAVTKLDPALLNAVRRAADDASDAGITLVVNSGWRSPAYQTQLLREAVVEYGSEEEAARWVATPTTSPHVSGNAIDLGPTDAAAWLSLHGAQYGLCQIYRNEPWHYELRLDAAQHGCPRMYADPTQDPRMQ